MKMTLRCLSYRKFEICISKCKEECCSIGFISNSQNSLVSAVSLSDCLIVDGPTCRTTDKKAFIVLIFNVIFCSLIDFILWLMSCMPCVSIVVSDVLHKEFAE
jgi:hypothetical protein